MNVMQLIDRAGTKLPPGFQLFLEWLDHPKNFFARMEQRVVLREQQRNEAERDELREKVAFLQDQNNEQVNIITGLEITGDMQERQLRELNQQVLDWQRQFHEFKKKTEQQTVLHRQQQEEAILEIARYAGLAEQFRRKAEELERQLEEKAVLLNFHLSRISELQRQQGENPHNNGEALAQGEARAFHRRNMPCI